jgi:hypothetical protein
MAKRRFIPIAAAASSILLAILACGLPLGKQTPVVIIVTPPQAETLPPEPPILQNATTTVTPTATVVHLMTPASISASGSLVYDVDSEGTAPEKRAPYGDSYDINRLERPFSQDMTYVKDLDIVTYSLTKDADWNYVSVQLVGDDPNNAMGINYGVVLDLDADGFGDYIIWAHPPYTTQWEASNVQVYADKNHDTGGLSAEKSDAPFDGDGYETLIFDGGQGDDPDLAWVRINAGTMATIQFAFKQSLSGSTFMMGVLADAGLKDVGKLDYVDRFTEEQAGSPIRGRKAYPLKELYAVDNTCREAFGFTPTGYEPQLCPRAEPTPEPGCENPSQYTDQSSCEAAGCAWRQDPAILVAVIYHCVAP